MPWPMIMQNAQGVDPQQMQELVTKLSALKLVISIGVRDKYLIVSMGDDNKHLGQLGQGALLYDRSEMEPIRKAARQTDHGNDVCQRGFCQKAGGIDTQIDQLRAWSRQLLPMSGLSTELTQEMASDVDKAAAYIKANVPKPGALLGVQLPDTRRDRGVLRIPGRPRRVWDASKNLTVLDHVGGDPIAFWAARGKSNPQADRTRW